MERASKPLFLIVDDGNDLMHFEGVRLFGVVCDIPAIFGEEQNALDVLWKVCEANPAIKPHRVIAIEGSFAATEVMYVGGKQ
jgi:hypothetical protein